MGIPFLLTYLLTYLWEMTRTPGVRFQILMGLWALTSHKINLLIQICRVRCKQTFHTGIILNGRTGRMQFSNRLPAIMHTILTYLLTYLLTYGKGNILPEYVSKRKDWENAILSSFACHYAYH